jgi:U3 small nucleolar RNA-associated protein 10
MVCEPFKENIIASNNYERHLTFLLVKMQDSNPFTHTMAHLVARALLSHLFGEQQIDAANKMMEAMRLETLHGMEDILDAEDGKKMVISLL